MIPNIKEAFSIYQKQFVDTEIDANENQRQRFTTKQYILISLYVLRGNALHVEFCTYFMCQIPNQTKRKKTNRTKTNRFWQ